MGLKDALEFTVGSIIHSAFRFVQLVLALAVCGLYGVDLSAANKQGKYSDGKWVRASSPLLPIVHLLTNTGIR